MSQVKHIAILILLGVGVSTALNKYFITDYDIQWWVAQSVLSMYLVLFAYFLWARTRRWYTFAILVIFVSELVGSLLGFNLSTTLFPEVLIAFSIFGIYTLFRKL